MKKKVWLVSGVCIAITVCAFLFFSHSLKVEIPFASSHAPPFKAWQIHFSQEMDPETFHHETVQVISADKKSVPVSWKWNVDHTVLTINAPESGYTIGETYQLIITDTVQTAGGKNFGDKFTHSFQAVDELPSIKNRKQLVTLLEERTEQTKEFTVLEEDNATADMKTESSAAENTPTTSETNVQVHGIDEGDLIKTDGNSIYFARDSDIIIAEANGKSSTAKSTISEEHFQPVELYVHKDLLIAIGNSSKSLRDQSKTAEYVMEQTSIIFYRISDQKPPEKIREVTLEGDMTASRQMDGYLYLVANSYPPYHILQDNKQNMDPRPFIKDSAVAQSNSQPLAYHDIYFFPESTENAFMLLASINLNDMEEAAQIESYLGASDQLYMSKNNIYIAMEKYDAALETSDSAEIAVNNSANTEIFQFHIDNGSIDFQNSLSVSGTLVNQFAMDERDGVFRVATTNEKDNTTTNNLYTFDSKLNALGSIEDLAKGEQIYSVRYLDNVAYMVTFKQVDPLFVIDLADPATPTVLGKLKIPGFSNYLHPLDKDHVIGFGQHTKLVQEENSNEPSVRMDGIKLSLFDVSDQANPKEIDSEVIGEGSSYTELNHNHKALFKHPGKNLFGFPAMVFDTKTVHKGDATYEEERPVFAGAFLYSITPEDGIVLKDTITHKENVQDYPEWDSEIRRIVSVDDNLYTFSYDQMRVYDLNGKKIIQTIAFPDPPTMN